MTADEPLVARLRARADGGVELLSPAVGRWSEAPPRGALVRPGSPLGRLLILGRAHAIVAPDGAHGLVAGDPPELLRAPVGAGDLLCALEPLRGQEPGEGAARRGETAASLLLRAPQAGRLWMRPEPGAPPYLAAGDLLEPGRTYGLLEVMKTFQPVRYRASAGLPERARLVRWLVADGAEVGESEPLAELALA